MIESIQYVGLRQWAALSRAELVYPQPANWYELIDAVKDATEHRNATGVISSLLEARMIRHSCMGQTHEEGHACWFTITERGRDAHLNRSGRRRLSARA